MLSLAIVLRITQDGGSYRLAGAVTAAYAIGISLTSPVLSRLIDRRGQTVVLVPCAVATARGHRSPRRSAGRLGTARC